MAIFEQAIRTEDMESYTQLAQSSEERATGMAEHWEGFNAGREQRFYAYYMLEHETHADDRLAFLRKIDASEEIPYPDNERQTVLKTGRAILWAVTQAYPGGDPFAVTYEGERIYPIE